MSPKRCAACKYLRRKCPPDCVLSPYFPPNDPQRFACVHRIYGASNVIKMLQQLDSHDLRARAAESLYFEAQHRIEDPVYGCVRVISQLHQQIHDAKAELAKTRAEIALQTSSTATISRHDHHHNRHHGDKLLEIRDSDLNNVLLQGQSSTTEQYSHYGHTSTTIAPWLV